MSSGYKQPRYWLELSIDPFHKSQNALVPYPTPLKITMCTFLFWMVRYGIWDKSMGFVNLVFSIGKDFIYCAISVFKWQKMQIYCIFVFSLTNSSRQGLILTLDVRKLISLADTATRWSDTRRTIASTRPEVGLALRNSMVVCSGGPWSRPSWSCAPGWARSWFLRPSSRKNKSRNPALNQQATRLPWHYLRTKYKCQ